MASFQVPICALALLVFIQVSSRFVYCTGSNDDNSYRGCKPIDLYVCEPVNCPGCVYRDCYNGYYGSCPGCPGCGFDKYFGCPGYGYSNGYGDNCVDGCTPNVCCFLVQLGNEKDCCGSSCGRGYGCYGEYNKSFKGDVDGSF